MSSQPGSRLKKAQEIIQSLETELREADRGLIALTSELEARAAALEESEARFRLMVEGSEEVFFFSHDTNGRFTYLSPSVERVLGYPPDQLLGTDYQDLLTEDLGNRDGVAGKNGAGATGEKGETYTVMVRHRSGREVRLEIAEQPVHGGPDGALRIQGFARDVTEQWRRQETLRETTRLMNAMIEASPAAICAMDQEGRVELWNPAAEALFGWAASEVLGNRLPGSTGDDELSTLVRHSLEGRPFSARNVRRERRDGGILNLNVSTAPLPAGDGGIDGVVAVVVDVSEQRKLEEQLLQSQKMDAVGRLAGGVAHDFNNILTAVTGHAQFALEELPAGSRVREEVLEVRRSAERAAALTRQLLAFSRHQVVRHRVVDVADAVRDIERMLRRIIGDDVELEARLEEGRVEADPGQLQQVVMNLAVNARDAMPEGGQLVLEVRPLEVRDPDPLSEEVPPGDYVRLSVSDTGHGIDPDAQKRLFEPFFTTKEVGKGTGLGLSTVYGIVKNTGGEIRVESAPGEGSRFEVYLPRVWRPVDVESEAAAPTGDSPAPLSATVLVVEDEAAVRKLVARVLERRGLDVLQAEGPRAALELATDRLSDIELVLSDVVMPGMSGAELIATLRERRSGLPALFMSGYTEDEVLRQGVVDMNVDFIEKPFTPEQLIRKVEAALRDR